MRDGVFERETALARRDDESVEVESDVMEGEESDVDVEEERPVVPEKDDWGLGYGSMRAVKPWTPLKWTL